MIPRLLFLGEGDRGAPTSTSPVSRRCKEGSGSRGGNRRGRGNKSCCEEGAREGKQMKGEKRRAIICLLFLGKGDRRAAAPSFNCLSDLAGSIRRVKRNKHKHDKQWQTVICISLLECKLARRSVRITVLVLRTAIVPTEIPWLGYLSWCLT